MKKNIILITLFLLANYAKAQTQEAFFSESNEFFKNNVSVDGKINYNSLKKSPGELYYIVGNVAKLKVDTNNKDIQIAFWINAYNLLVIKNVIDNFPVKSVNFVTNFFDTKFFIANTEVTLNEIELKLNDLLKDASIHFVLAKGTNGGSILLNSAYLPETISYQMSLKVKSTLNKPGFIKINKDSNSIELPTFFQTYKKDFVTMYFNEIDFLNVFLENKIDNKMKITYNKPDGTLNEK